MDRPGVRFRWWSLVVGAVATLVTGLLTASPPATADAAAPHQPARVWLVRAPGWEARLSAAPDGGVLVSACSDTDPRAAHRYVSADGLTRVRYPARERFSYACGDDVAFGPRRQLYYSGYRGGYWGVQARGPLGAVLWTKGFFELGQPTGGPELGADGRLWLTLHTTYPDGGLVVMNRATGTWRRLSHGATSALPVLAAEEGLTLVERGQPETSPYPAPAEVNWLDYRGAVTHTQPLPPEGPDWIAANAVAGRDRSVFVAGCEFAGALQVLFRTPAGGAWSWSAPLDSRCLGPDPAATPDGGVVVGRFVADDLSDPTPETGVPTFVRLSADGDESWTHMVAPPRAVVDWVQRPAVDADGRVLVGYTVRSRCPAGYCRRGMVDVLHADGTLVDTLLLPGLRGLERHGTTLTDLTLGPGRLYVALKGRNNNYALGLDVPEVNARPSE